MVRLSREFGSDLCQLTELRRVVREACQTAWGASADPEMLDRIELAVQEAGSNIIRHAFDGSPTQAVELLVEVDADELRLSLLHRGRDFDPAEIRPPSFDGSRSGGFGHFLIRQCMDDVRYIHDDRGRHGIRLVKRRRAVRKGEHRMQVLVETFGDVAVVALHAEQLDATNADDFVHEIEPILREHNKVVLDLGRVNFVDSRGCGAILSCLRRLTEHQGDLKLCKVNRPVRIVFDLIRLHKICTITDTKDQAVSAFAKKE
jgi:anti-sigma B factor antagonist